MPSRNACDSGRETDNIYPEEYLGAFQTRTRHVTGSPTKPDADRSVSPAFRLAPAR